MGHWLSRSRVFFVCRRGLSDPSTKKLFSALMLGSLFRVRSACKSQFVGAPYQRPSMPCIPGDPVLAQGGSARELPKAQAPGAPVAESTLPTSQPWCRSFFFGASAKEEPWSLFWGVLTRRVLFLVLVLVAVISF